MFTKILGFLGLSGCVLAPVAGEREKLDAVAKKDRPSILFVGNSYSFGIPKEFGELSASRGKDVRIGHSTYSGWSLTKGGAEGGINISITGVGGETTVISENTDQEQDIIDGEFTDV